MNVYKISCRSDCGTYFKAYLQSVTVVAESEEEALKLVRGYNNDHDSFIYPEKRMFKRENLRGDVEEYEVRWGVEVLASDISTAQVIDTHHDSDY